MPDALGRGVCAPALGPAQTPGCSRCSTAASSFHECVTSAALTGVALAGEAGDGGSSEPPSCSSLPCSSSLSLTSMAYPFNSGSFQLRSVLRSCSAGMGSPGTKAAMIIQPELNSKIRRRFEQKQTRRSHLLSSEKVNSESSAVQIRTYHATCESAPKISVHVHTVQRPHLY